MGCVFLGNLSSNLVMKLFGEPRLMKKHMKKSSTICQRFTDSTLSGLQDLVVAPKGEKILSLLPSFKEGAMFHDLSHGTPSSISLHHFCLFCLEIVELAWVFSLCMYDVLCISSLNEIHIF